MPRYRVVTMGTTFYEEEIEAENPEQAKEIAEEKELKQDNIVIGYADTINITEIDKIRIED